MLAACVIAAVTGATYPKVVHVAAAPESPSTAVSSFWKKLDFDFPGKRGTVIDPDRTKASALMQRRKLADCEKAIELYELALARNPDDPALCLEAANALSAYALLTPASSHAWP